eukprot:748505-Hanusia_phi.AAC.1
MCCTSAKISCDLNERREGGRPGSNRTRGSSMGSGRRRRRKCRGGGGGGGGSAEEEEEEEELLVHSGLSGLSHSMPADGESEKGKE